MSVFCYTYDLESLIKEPTYYKNPENPSRRYLILTNNPKCFQSSRVVEADLSDFNRMRITVMKKTLRNFSQ